MLIIKIGTKAVYKIKEKIKLKTSDTIKNILINIDIRIHLLISEKD